MPSRRAIRDVAAKMVALVPTDVLADLQDEDPALAVQVHYEPVRVRPLPRSSLAGSDCSVDGYYEANLDPGRPVIFYSDDAVAERVRFTIVHELGHHILVTEGARLLDDLDRIGGSDNGAINAEESACHQFAGEVLVPAPLLKKVIGDDVLRPNHLVKLHDRTSASWEVIAIQAASYPSRSTAVVLVRQGGEVAFAAANGLPIWPRYSEVEPGGPLDRALARESITARPEIYRYSLGGAERLYCDTLRVHSGLAIAVLSSQRSDGRLSVLRPVDPAWREREEFCPWCNDERDVGWCYDCSGRRCRTCGRCGCQQRVENLVCPSCNLEGPFRAGAQVCIDCEAAGAA